MELLERELAGMSEMAVPEPPTVGELRQRGLRRRRRRHAAVLAGGALAMVLSLLGTVALLAQQEEEEPVVAADDSDAEGSSTPSTTLPDSRDLERTFDRLREYHRAAGPPGARAGEEVRFAPSVAFGVGDNLTVIRTPAELAETEGWHLPLDRSTGRDGVYAFDLFFENLETGQYRLETGDYEKCGQGARPAELADAGRVSAQPIADVPCSEWWAVDVYIDDADQVVALTAQWATADDAGEQVLVLNGSGRCGIAGNVAEAVRAQPFAAERSLTLLPPANAMQPVDRSTIYADPTGMAAAEQIAALLQLDANVEPLRADTLDSVHPNWNGPDPAIVVVLGSDQASAWPGC